MMARECDDGGELLLTISVHKPIRKLSEAERHYLASALGTIGCEIMNHKTLAVGWVLVFDPDEYRIEVPDGEVSKAKVNPAG